MKHIDRNSSKVSPSDDQHDNLDGEQCPMWKEGELLEPQTHFSPALLPKEPATALSSQISLVDKLMITVGLLFRIQTVVIFVVLLFVEYDNDCRVVRGEQTPLS